MTQLAFSLAPPPKPIPHVTRLIWEAAGRPANTTGKDRVVDVVAHDGLCWWCGAGCRGQARPRSILPKTFPFPLEASAPESEHLCLPCGWTLCDRISLPKAMAERRIRSKAQVGRRQTLCVGDETTPGKWLTLELADGRVGLWTLAKNTTAEKPWNDARAELREEPVDVGPCVLTHVVTYDDLDAGPVEKFRSFHHLAHPGHWFPCTDSHRSQIRAWLLEPPAPPWVAVIGDGKKHHAIAAQLLGTVTTHPEHCVAYYLGATVHYRPDELRALVGAIETLIRAGAGDDEIRDGSYAPRGWDLLVAQREAEPVVGEARGSALLDLALYLRRNRKELADADQ